MFIWTVAYHLYQLPGRNYVLKKAYKGLNKWFWKHYAYLTQTAGYYWNESWSVWQTRHPWPKMLTYEGSIGRQPIHQTTYSGQPSTNPYYKYLVSKYQRKQVES